MSNQQPLPMRRRLDDMSNDEQCALLAAMNSFLAGILAQRMMDKTAPTTAQPAPADTFKDEALQQAEAIL